MTADLPTRIEAAIADAEDCARSLLPTNRMSIGWRQAERVASCARQVLRAAEVDRRDFSVARDIGREEGPDVDLREMQIAADLIYEGLAECYGVSVDE